MLINGSFIHLKVISLVDVFLEIIQLVLNNPDGKWEFLRRIKGVPRIYSHAQLAACPSKRDGCECLSKERMEYLLAIP